MCVCVCVCEHRISCACRVSLSETHRCSFFSLYLVLVTNLLPSPGRLPSMSSASVDLSRIMSDDIATEMLRFAHDHSIHSLSYGDGDIVHMDFAALEEFLVSRWGCILRG